MDELKSNDPRPRATPRSDNEERPLVRRSLLILLTLGLLGLVFHWDWYTDWWENRLVAPPPQRPRTARPYELEMRWRERRRTRTTNEAPEAAEKLMQSAEEMADKAFEKFLADWPTSSDNNDAADEPKGSALEQEGSPRELTAPE